MPVASASSPTPTATLPFDRHRRPRRPRPGQAPWRGRRRRPHQRRHRPAHPDPAGHLRGRAPASPCCSSGATMPTPRPIEAAAAAEGSARRRAGARLPPTTRCWASWPGPPGPRSSQAALHQRRGPSRRGAGERGGPTGCAARDRPPTAGRLRRVVLVPHHGPQGPGGRRRPRPTSTSTWPTSASPRRSPCSTSASRTNTLPTWERAQPFRLLCHNGEINTIERQREPHAGAGPAGHRGRRPRAGGATCRRCSIPSDSRLGHARRDRRAARPRRAPPQPRHGHGRARGVGADPRPRPRGARASTRTTPP